jgi:hypothetical protein
MKTILIALLILSPVSADELVDTERIAKLLQLPGLKLEIEDHTERESKVRNIHFNKVAYMRVAQEGYIYPMVIWIAPKGALDSEKYNTLRKYHLEADTKRAERLKKIAAAYFPETDNAVVSLDEIQMTKRLKLDGIVGDQWVFNTPYVGGLSITATNEQLGLDYQILLTGAEKQDPALAAKYPDEIIRVTDEEYHKNLKELIALVRDSPLMASATIKVSPREERREVLRIPRDEKNSNTGVSGSSAMRSTVSSVPLWPWIVSLFFIIIGMVIFFVRRSKH